VRTAYTCVHSDSVYDDGAFVEPGGRREQQAALLLANAPAIEQELAEGSAVVFDPEHTCVRALPIGELRPAADGQQAPWSVLRTDNAPRVRDGYVTTSTSGHARALPTHR
jgi:hypothetical protein